MKETIILAMEFYFITFVVALFIAGLIKGMLAVIRRISPKKEMTNQEK